MSDVKIDKSEIIDLILCADYYQFDHDILYSFLFEKLGDMSPDDIESYIYETYDPQNEDEMEDCDIKTGIIVSLKDKYDNLEEVDLEN